MLKPNIMDSSLYKVWLEEKGNLSEGSINLYVRGIEMFLRHSPDLEDLEAYNKFLIIHCMFCKISNFDTTNTIIFIISFFIV